MSDLRESFERDFEATFGPAPSKSDWTTANAMQVDSAVWGQRMQGAKWAVKWFARYLADVEEQDGAVSAAKILRLANQLSE